MADWNALLEEALEASVALDRLTAAAGGPIQPLVSEVGAMHRGLEALSDALGGVRREDAESPSDQAFGRTRALQDEVAAGLDAAIGHLM
jgi:hypothetical protein